MTARRCKRTGRAVCALAAAVLLGVAGCGGPRNSLGTASSACYRALPPATDAVSRKGKLVGVRKIHTATLKNRLPADRLLAAVRDSELCVVAFKGTFQPVDVPLATTTVPGTYAVVAVSIRHPAIVAAFILNRLPARFGHLR
jgi:hypothetical protein